MSMGGKFWCQNCSRIEVETEGDVCPDCFYRTNVQDDPFCALGVHHNFVQVQGKGEPIFIVEGNDLKFNVYCKLCGKTRLLHTRIF